MSSLLSVTSETAPSRVQRPRRWSVPFADELEESEMTEEMAVTLLERRLRSLLQDADKFPPSLSLTGIIANDARVLELKPETVVMRKGDYGNSAFLILEGSVHLVTKDLPSETLGRMTPSGHLRVLRRLARVLLGKRRYPEVRDADRQLRTTSYRRQTIHLQDFPEILLDQQLDENDPDFDPDAVELQQPDPDSQVGEIFGEIAALGRTPRTATVVAGEQGVSLLEIRWQGIREIRRYSPGWKEMLDERYRKYSLKTHLKEAPWTRNLRRERSMLDSISDGMISELDLLARQTQFQSWGDFDWYGSFKEVAAQKPEEAIQLEPVLVRQDDVVHGLIMVRSGFLRVRHRYNHGEQTISYLGKGQSYGMAQILENWRRRCSMDDPEEDLMTFQHTLSAVGYVDTLFIPAHVVEELIIPRLTDADTAELDQEIARYKEATNGHADLDGNVLEFLMEKRAINGAAAMLIDLDRCTRCDDCVRACASTHENNPRFVRHGFTHDGIQLTHACMHCADPVCMIGCPTGAIHRDESGEQVVINDYTCIGCSTCANNCPWDNIQMVEIRDAKGDFMPGSKMDEKSGTWMRQEPTEAPFLKATKCDLCESIPTGPACVQACPHDALARVDLREPEPLTAWLTRR